MTEATGGRTVIAVTVAVVLVAVAVGVGSVPGAAQDADADLACVGSGGGAAYVTDSNLTVYENDTDATIDTFYFPDSETVRFEYSEDAVNLSATGTAQTRLENATGTTTCLGDVNATDHDVTVAPDGENDVTLNGTFDGISFRDANFSAEDAGIDLAYNASDPTAVTVHNTSRQSGTEIVARSASDGSELDRGTVGADGSVTFDGLPSGEYDLDFEVDSGEEFFAVSIVDVNGSVTAGEDVIVDATVENTGSVSGTQTVEFTVNGTTEADRSVTLDASESTTETFTYATGTGDMAAIEVGVESENDIATRTVSVASPDTYAGGDGTASNPYEIANWYHLNITRDNLDANFTLVADLNASTDGYDEVANGSANGDRGFEPIGEYDPSGGSTPFTGTFDGQGHTISNLTVNRSSENYVGLFGYVESGTFSNVTLSNVDIDGNERVGSVVANVNGGTVRNVKASGIVNGTADVGGLVGYFDGSAITNSSASVATTARKSQYYTASNVGGVVGGIYQGDVTNVHASGSVNATGDYAGGVVGEYNIGTLSNSTATGDVDGDGHVGGLVGYTTSSVTVRESWATGAVNGSSKVGGLLGHNNHGLVNASYATGNVSGSDYVGGVVGDNDGTVEQSYAIGSVDGVNDVGGLVGHDSGTVTDGYWNSETTGKIFSAGSPDANGLTTRELRNNDSLTGFDYGSTWTVLDATDAVSYPYLQANPQTPAPGRAPVAVLDIGAFGDQFSDSTGAQNYSVAEIPVEETNNVSTDSLTVTLTVTDSSGNTVYNETNVSLTLRNETATVGFAVGEIATSDDYTATVTANGVFAVEKTATESFTISSSSSGGAGGGGGGSSADEETEESSGALSAVISALAETEPTREAEVDIQDASPDEPGVTVETGDSGSSVEQVTFDDETTSGSVTITEYSGPPEAVTDSITQALAGGGDDTEPTGEETESDSETTDDGTDGDSESDDGSDSPSVTVLSVADISSQNGDGTAGDADTGATVTMRVDADDVTNPSNVVILHETADGWEQLETSVEETNDGIIRFTARTESFSLFAVAEVTTAESTESTDTTTENDQPDDQTVDTPSQSTGDEQQTDDASQSTPEDEEDEADKTGSRLGLVFAVLVVIAALTAGFWLRQRDEDNS